MSWLDNLKPLPKAPEIKLWMYAAVDMYGGMMAWTAADTKDEAIAKFRESYSGETLESLHCAVVRIVPMFVCGDELHHFNQQRHFDFLNKGKTE